MKRTSGLLLSVAGMILVLAVVLLTGHTAMAGGFAGGSGTEEDPWEIETPEQLASVADAVYLESYFELITNIDLTGFLSEEGAGWNDGAGWQPIGTATEPFTGSLDGAEYSIVGLFINRSGTDYQGLFGYIGSSTVIQDINLVDVEVIGRQVVGALVGCSNGGTITECTVTGPVTGHTIVGGLVGSNSGAVSASYATGAVTAGYQSRYIGGLVGSNSGTVSTSYATGAVTGGNESRYIGGLVGSNSGTVSGSYASGAVTGVRGIQYFSYYIGGLVGSNSGTVSTSYATGAVTGDMAIGGSVGENEGSVTSCYATGPATGRAGVGGLVGSSAQGTIAYSYAKGAVAGEVTVGGLVGWLDSGTVTASYYDNETSGQSDTGKGEPRTTAQMQTPVTFSGWDFLSTWGINPEENGGYPFLRWQTEYIDAPRFNGGTGDAGNPYQIATPWHLNNVRLYPHKHFVLVNDLDMDVAPYNEGQGWEPIGMWVNFFDPGNAPFTGSFDGDGYVIENLFIKQPGVDSVGLFSCVEGAVITNVRLENADVTGNEYVGGLVGHNFGMITRSYVTGEVSGADSVGGMVGQNFYNGTIESSFSVATVSGADKVGGLLGSNYNGEVTASYATGGVSGSGRVGGLAGFNDGDINGCYAAGSVTGASSTGGLVGYNQGGTVTASYYDSDTSGQSDTGKGEPKTTVEMKRRDTFVGWDFDEPGTWRIVDGFAYPVLQWQSFSTEEIDEMLRVDREALQIVFAEGDSADSVTSDVTLPDSGAVHGSGITWVSGDPSVIADDGTVTTPEEGSKTITLTATISMEGGTDQTKEFVLTIVPRAQVSATISPAAATYDLISPGDVETTITWNDATTVTGLVYGIASLDPGTDYTVDSIDVASSKLAIDDIFIGDLNAVVGSELEFTISFDAGEDAVLTVNIVSGYVPVALQSIVVTNPPAKTTYLVGESLELDGLVVTGTYSDDSTAVLPVTLANITGFDSSEPATGQVVTVTYEGKTATFAVDIEDIPAVPSDNANLGGLAISAGTLSPDFDSAVTSYSVSVGSSVSSIQVTPTTADNRATVTVNGITVASGNARSVSLGTGTNGIGIVVTAENGTTSRIYTITVNRAPSTSGGGGGGGGPHTPGPAFTLPGGSIVTVPKLDKNTGVASVAVNTGTLTKAFDTATESSGGKKGVVIEVPKVEGAKVYEFTCPASILSSSDANRQLVINTEIAAVTLPTDMLTQDAAAGAKDVSFTIQRADLSGISEEIRDQIGDRPIIQLSLTIDGEPHSWRNESAPATVSIPYTPTAQELTDPEHITVWYIDGDGNVVQVPNGRYDLATGTVTFTTTHFSRFVVVYVTKTFDDLESVAWVRKPIEVLASKGILRGIAEKEYVPQANITRADFLYSLVRALGVDAKIEGNFDDVSPDAYYYKEIAIAKKLGITHGTGDNKFSPDASITRMDMMVLAGRALGMLKKLEVRGAAPHLDVFADKLLITDYATDIVASIVKEGLIVGSGDKINPLGSTTRAEAAMFLYRIYNKY